MKLQKQDRQGVRTPAELEQKYDLGGMSPSSVRDYAKLARSVEQLNTTLAQFMGATNTSISKLIQEVSDMKTSLSDFMTYVDEKFEEYHPTFSITYNLTNCVSSNESKTIAEGEAYAAVISCEDGLTLTYVNILMGSENITDAACVRTESGTVEINIASVTEHVVITAEATTGKDSTEGVDV